jgi:hypothetical protein
MNFRSFSLAAFCVSFCFAPSLKAEASPRLQQPSVPIVSANQPGLLAQRNAQPTWSKFSPKDGNFSVLMPGKPKEEQKTGTSPDEPVEDRTYSVETKEGLFIVAYADFAQDIAQANPKDVLDEVTKGFATGGTKVVSQREISLNGTPGREVEYTVAAGLNAQARIFLVDKRLYLVQVVTTKNEDRQRFLNSFQLIKKS